MKVRLASLCLAAAIGVSACSPASAPVEVRTPAFKPAVGAAVCQGGLGYTASGARTFIWRPDWLSRVEADARDPSSATAAAVRQLTANADRALQGRPPSVMDKSATPAGGDKHDFYSLATYWWPNPDKPDGVPYVRRDGQRNPERLSDRFDLTSLNAMAGDVTTLGLAYRYTGDKAYADRAALLLRIWFLAPETRMNPNLKFAQAAPGLSDGRGTGIIDTRGFVPMVEAIGLIEKSGALTPAELADLKTWFSKYVDWLTTSAAGKDEGGSDNNHAIHYDAQVMSFALFAGREDVARKIALAFPARRLATQVDAQGGLPKELARPASFHYVTFNLTGMSQVASLAECVQVDLWRAEGDKKTLRSAIDYLAPYAGRDQAWPHKDGSAAEERAADLVLLRALLNRAAWAYADDGLAARAAVYPELPPGDPWALVVPSYRVGVEPKTPQEKP